VTPIVASLPGRCAPDETAAVPGASRCARGASASWPYTWPSISSTQRHSSGKFAATSTNCLLPWAQAVRQQNLHRRKLRNIARERVTLLNGRARVFGPLLQHFGEVLAFASDFSRKPSDYCLSPAAMKAPQ
jgi:hypothetical protein